MRGRPAALVLVGRNVGAEGLQVAEAVPGHHDVGTLALDKLKIDGFLLNDDFGQDSISVDEGSRFISTHFNI